MARFVVQANFICTSIQIEIIEGCKVLDSKALTKIQSVALIAIILVAAVAGSAAYFLWSGPAQSTENIRIGVCTDLNSAYGKNAWQGAVLAAEQINAEGGILGKNITIVAEDDDSFTPPGDIAVATNALTKLITVDKADYVISPGGSNALVYQDVCSEHKKIFIGVAVPYDEYSQRVLDNYEKYRYSFRTYPLNYTITAALMLGEVIAVANYTGFTKVALLFDDGSWAKAVASSLSKSLPDYGLKVVYSAPYSLGITDFTSCLAAIEASGAEILVPWILIGDVPFVKEWYDRQSPFVVWGRLESAQDSDFWELTEGKCDTISSTGLPAVAGYPLTNKTVPAREAYIQRWGEIPNAMAVAAYDALRFILSDAIKRAGTTETEAVIKALEKTDIETTSARHFIFTSSHDIMVGFESPTNPSEDYFLQCYFQWQNGTQMPMYPKAMMKEAGATYKYPPWHGPWGNKQTP